MGKVSAKICSSICSIYYSSSYNCSSYNCSSSYKGKVHTSLQQRHLLQQVQQGSYQPWQEQPVFCAGCITGLV